MKKFSVWSVLLLSIISFQVFGQECMGFKLKEGSGFEMENYDGKGKSVGKMIYKIVKVSSEGGSVIYSVEMESFSNKGKSELKNTYTLKCDGNVMTMDAASLISQEQLKSFKDMEMTFTYDNIEYPGKYSVGDKLKDASVKGEGKSSSIPVNFKMFIKNRTVTGQEKLAVPAGSYDAYKLTADLNMEMAMGFPIKMEMQTVSYRVPDIIWDLKTETYRKGKLMAYSELTKIY